MSAFTFGKWQLFASLGAVVFRTIGGPTILSSVLRTPGTPSLSPPPSITLSPHHDRILLMSHGFMHPVSCLLVISRLQLGMHGRNTAV